MRTFDEIHRGIGVVGCHCIVHFRKVEFGKSICGHVEPITAGHIELIYMIIRGSIGLRITIELIQHIIRINLHNIVISEKHHSHVSDFVFFLFHLLFHVLRLN
jgi:hypothetical protein